MSNENNKKRIEIMQLTREAQSFVLQGKKEEALNCYDKISEKYPDELRALYGKGMVFFEFDELETAIEFFDKVLEINPDEHDSLYAKGTILSSMGKSVQAMEYIDKFIELKPKFHIGWLSKGYALFDLEKYEEAMTCFEKVRELGYPDDVYNGMGHVLRKLDRLKESEQNYQRALKLDPFDPEALFGLGMIEYSKKNLKKAREFLYKSIVQDEENLEAWEAIAEVYKLTNDTKREEIARNKIKELKA